MCSSDLDCYTSALAPTGAPLISALQPNTRTDNNGDVVFTGSNPLTVTVTSGSSTVVDSAAIPPDAGWEVSGTGIPTNPIGGSLSAGEQYIGVCNVQTPPAVTTTQFTLCNLETGAPVNATANAASITLTAINS